MKRVLFEKKDVMGNYDPRAMERTDWTQAKEIGGKEGTKKKRPGEGGAEATHAISDLCGHPIPRQITHAFVAGNGV